MRPERVTQKVEALLKFLLDAGLRLIQGDTHPCYHLPRPIQRLCRLTATENHKIVRVVHNMSVKLLSPFGVPPTLQRFMYRFEFPAYLRAISSVPGQGSRTILPYLRQSTT